MTIQSNSPHDDGRNDPLLWEMGRRLPEPAEVDDSGTDSDAEQLSDALLDDYRHGAVNAEQKARIEEILVASAAARSRLAALAGIDSLQPSERVREAVLAAFEGTERTAQKPASAPNRVATFERRTESVGTGSRRAGASSNVWVRWTAIAASLFFAVLWWRAPLEPMPEGLQYNVAVTGVADVRSADIPTDDSILRAFPDTRITVSATPNRSIGHVTVGLYREAAGTVQRIDLGPAEVEIERGAVRIRGRAADLLGDKPDQGRLILVVARAGDLPAPVSGGADLVATWRDGDRRHVHAVEYQLLAPRLN